MRGAVLFWNIICCFGIQVRTLGSEDASFDLKVISKSVPDEIDGIVVAGFEIYMVDVVPPRPINDPADASPQACHCAHSARLECAVNRVALQRCRHQVVAQPPNDDHLGMGSRIMPHLTFIESNRCRLAVANEHSTYAFASGSSPALSGSPNRQFHESHILFAGHLSSIYNY
jgi:hypothetical protein